MEYHSSAIGDGVSRMWRFGAYGHRMFAIRYDKCPIFKLDPGDEQETRVGTCRQLTIMIGLSLTLHIGINEELMVAHGF